MRAPLPLLAAMLLLAGSAAMAQQPAAAPCATQEQAIREEAFVLIGGIDQWITIKGDICANPVILFLHGGPGNPLSPYSAALYGAWEKDFTIVQWDQRGAGRTFGRNRAAAEADLSVPRMTQDGIEVAEYLVRRLGKRKLILVGGSWGSVLGIHMAHARPDLFSAYVGVGQLVSYRQNQVASYRNLLSLAHAAADTQTVDKIEALGPPPWTDPRAFGILRKATRPYEARASTPAPKSWWVPAEAYTSPQMEADYEGGEDYSYIQFVGLKGDGMLSTVDLPALGNRFEIPIYLVQGAEDLVTAPEVAKLYFDTLSAPRKKYVLLPRTGHDPNPPMMAAIYAILKNDIAAAAVR